MMRIAATILILTAAAALASPWHALIARKKANAGGGDSGTTEYLFAGQWLYAPVTSSGQRPRWENGSVCDSAVSNGSTYHVFGPVVTNAIITGTWQVTDGYLGAGPFGDYPSNGHVHGGVMVRYQDSSDFAGLACLAPEADELQIIDRVGGTEYVTRVAVPGGVDYDTTYSVTISNVTGNAASAHIYDAGMSLLTNVSWTFETGVPASGRMAVHTYASEITVTDMVARDGAGTLIVDAQEQPWVNTYPGATAASGIISSNDVLEFYANGSFSSVNNWAHMQTGPAFADGTVTGTLTRVSATRIFGISFRTTPDGDGYAFAHDTSNGLRLYKNMLSGITVLNTWSPVTMTTGVAYPFGLTLDGTNFTFNLNGTDYSYSDTTYTNGGIGVFGYRVQGRVADLKVTEATP